MEASATQLRMSLSDVASLAKVQRPVVSMWRKRSSGSPIPFPAAIRQDHGREVFNADEVAAWLTATGRGNNPEAQNDVAAFAQISGLAVVDGQAQHPRIAFDGLTALLALKVMTGGPVSGLASDELLDSADECDPDDLFLYSELESLGAALPATAACADRLVDSAYSAPAAFEKLLADRFRSGLRDLATAHLETRLMSDVLKPILGGTLQRSRSDFWDGSRAWSSAKDITGADFGVVTDTDEKITDLAVAGTKAKPLPTGSVILTARGTVGAVARLAAHHPSTNRATDLSLTKFHPEFYTSRSCGLRSAQKRLPTVRSSTPSP